MKALALFFLFLVYVSVASAEITGSGDAQIVFDNGLILNVSCCQPFDNITTVGNYTIFEVNGTLFNVTIHNNSKLANFSYLSNTTYKMKGSFSVQQKLNATTNYTVKLNGTDYTTFQTDSQGYGVYDVASSGLSEVFVIPAGTSAEQTTYTASGFVFDNNNAPLSGVTVQNNTHSNTTDSNGFYLITGLANGSYNFSFSKNGFDTAYLTLNISGSDIINQNKTIYDTSPPESVSNLQNITYATTYINWTWSMQSEVDHVMVYINGSHVANTSNQYYNATNLSPDTSYTISTRTVDVYENVNTTWVNHTAITASQTFTPGEPYDVVNFTEPFLFQVTWYWTPGENTDEVEVQINASSKGYYGTNYTESFNPHETKTISLRAHNTTSDTYSAWTNQTTTLPNNPVTLGSIGNKTVTEGEWLNFTLYSTDLDNDAPQYTGNNLPPGASLVGANFSWKAVYGTYSDVQFVVSDGYGSSDYENITIYVNSASAYTINLTAGWNIIGWTNTTSITAEALLNEIGGSAQYASIRYPNGTYVSHTKGFASNNFILERGWGYYVYVTTNTSYWRPS